MCGRIGLAAGPPRAGATSDTLHCRVHFHDTRQDGHRSAESELPGRQVAVDKRLHACTQSRSQELRVAIDHGEWAGVPRLQGFGILLGEQGEEGPIEAAR